MKLFCKHEWKVLSETVTESKLEHSLGLIEPLRRQAAIPGQLVDADRKHIQVFTCDKCGKLKRFVENI